MSDTAMKDEDEELTFQDATDAFNESIPVHELGYAFRAYIRFEKKAEEAAKDLGIDFEEYKKDLRLDYDTLQRAVNRGLSPWGT